MLLPRRLGREDHGYVKRPLSTKKGDERGLENNYTLLIPGKTFVFWRILQAHKNTQYKMSCVSPHGGGGRCMKQRDNTGMVLRKQIVEARVTKTSSQAKLMILPPFLIFRLLCNFLSYINLRFIFVNSYYISYLKNFRISQNSSISYNQYLSISETVKFIPQVSIQSNRQFGQYMQTHHCTFPAVTPCPILSYGCPVSPLLVPVPCTVFTFTLSSFPIPS